jgi:hypothetical protein
METTKIEVANIERTIADVIESESRELSELQLSLIGGGIGEVIVG